MKISTLIALKFLLRFILLSQFLLRFILLSQSYEKEITSALQNCFPFVNHSSQTQDTVGSISILISRHFYAPLLANRLHIFLMVSQLVVCET